MNNQKMTSLTRLKVAAQLAALNTGDVYNPTMGYRANPVPGDYELSDDYKTLKKHGITNNLSFTQEYEGLTLLLQGKGNDFNRDILQFDTEGDVVVASVGIHGRDEVENTSFSINFKQAMKGTVNKGLDDLIEKIELYKPSS